MSGVAKTEYCWGEWRIKVVAPTWRARIVGAFIALRYGWAILTSPSYGWTKDGPPA